jgi:hypothetical membrane protein
MRRWVLASASAAPVALIGAWTVGAARQPAAYDPVRDTISALAAHGARDPWVMTTGLAVLGGCHLATALGLVEARLPGRVVLGVGGVSAVLVAAMPQPSPGHFPAATLSFVALSVWPAASGVPGRRSALVASGGLLALLGWLGVELGSGPRLGRSERVVAGAQALWPLVVVVVLRRRLRRTRGQGA